MSSSAPKTLGPMRRRTSSSTGAISACASSTVPAFAVSRTLISPEEARNATVGFWCSSKRSSSISPTRDSDSPQVRMSLLTTTASPPSLPRCRKGRTSFSTIGIISAGTPGTAKIQRPSNSSRIPGAVPFGLGTSSAPSGRYAWRTLDSGISRPRRCHHSRSRCS